MQTYLVLYFVGNIIFTLGPYPKGADDVCKTSAAQLQEQARNHWSEFQTIVSVPIRAMDLIADCVRAEKRPAIKE